MKLNISSEKLIRLMLTTNPTLARYKGSIAAIRLLLNTLGIKCIITNQSFSAVYTLSNLPVGYNIHENVFGGILMYSNTKHIGIIHTTFPVDLGIFDYNEETHVKTLINIVTVQLKYKTETSATLTLNIYNTNSINNWNTSDNTRLYPVYEKSSNELNKLLILAYNEFAEAINNRDKQRFPLLGDATLNLDNVVIDDYNTDERDFNILLTNISDKNAEPIKSILAKQLQEVLPINIVVTPENIIGCASNE